jgi:hypothetical protein
MIALALAGCSSGWPGDPVMAACAGEPVDVAPDEPVPAGFSADDVVDWLGDVLLVDVTWTGKSRTPARDTFQVAVDGLAGTPQYTEMQPLGSVDPETCPDQLSVPLAVEVATDDGGVTGLGTMTAWVIELDWDQLRLDLEVPSATLTDARWDEVHAWVDPSLPPPTAIEVGLGHDSYGDHAIVAASSDRYTEKIWACQEPRKGDCATWR